MILDDILKRRNQQTLDFLDSTSHLGIEERVYIIMSWMHVDDVDRMLETVAKDLPRRQKK